VTEREERVARNEAMTREMNEEIEQAHPRSPADNFRVICECGNSDCTRVIAIAVDEYEEVRSDARHFVVVGAHVMSDVEEVVRETERFTVVRKREGTPAEISEEADPRS
jgi:hypothetical protein